MDNWFVSHAYWILLFPFISFVFNGLYLGRKNWRACAWVAVMLNGLSLLFVLKIASYYYTTVIGDPASFPDKTLIAWEKTWLSLASLSHVGFDLTAKMGIFLDPISVVMLVVVSVISVLVNVYSIGYMEGDESAGRFFPLLSLFVFSMLGLVVATNIFQMFVFWELVGISSYLLIGFWYQKPSAVAACKKAFIVTRFADAFFLLGIILLAYTTRTFDFLELNSVESAAILNRTVSFGLFTVNLLTLGTLLVFVGGWGKSAMFPLHVWLPDAMEGPTPVSAIIHSATMVVAGVYLTARMFPLFAASAVTLQVVAFVGIFTALFTAIIACTQTDIKRILAFSTLSQLGYMLFALGTAKLYGHSSAHEVHVNLLGFSASMFHVFTHSFFKCLLFLSAGAIIHVVHSNELNNMGGLRKVMPLTYYSTLVACLSIAGIFPFSGFFSKDEILLTAYQNGHTFTFTIGLLVGGLTAFYMFRFFFLIFHGEPKKDHHGHENKFMTFSIVVLAVPSLLIGWLSKDLFIGLVTPHMAVMEGHFAHPSWLPFVATGMGLIGLFGAWALYGRGSSVAADSIKSRFGRVYTLVQNKFYIDELYLFITKKIIFAFVATPAKWFDRYIVDGFMNLVGFSCRMGGSVVHVIQNGQVQFYLGIVFIGIYLIYRFGLA